jgi:uncharacterized tellurite resistance protein B-like protein
MTGEGVMHCHRCGGDRRYLRCRGRRWIHVLGVPVLPLDRVPEHLQCRSCRTRYRPGVLALPTAEAMQEALPVASLAAVTTMLRAGSTASPAARLRAIQIVQTAGLTGYDEVALSADLAAADGGGLDISAPLSMLAAHLTPPAPEWFLADVIGVGLADGALSGAERSAARLVAAHLGLSAAQAQDVIVRTEENAAAG